MKQSELTEKQIDDIIKACESGDDLALDTFLNELSPKKSLTKEQKDRNKSIWDKISD